MRQLENAARLVRLPTKESIFKAGAFIVNIAQLWNGNPRSHNKIRALRQEKCRIFSP